MLTIQYKGTISGFEDAHLPKSIVESEGENLQIAYYKDEGERELLIIVHGEGSSSVLTNWGGGWNDCWDLLEDGSLGIFSKMVPSSP